MDEFSPVKLRRDDGTTVHVDRVLVESYVELLDEDNKNISTQGLFTEEDVAVLNRVLMLSVANLLQKRAVREDGGAEAVS